MKENFYIQIFEGKKVRIVWDAEKEKYYFAVADIVEILTESKDVKQYIKRMRARDPELNSRWGTICTPTRMTAADGKPYMTNASDLEGIFRIIQSIPSKKAEPVKKWLAEVGAQRVDQMIDPELTFQMAVMKCKLWLLLLATWAVNGNVTAIDVRDPDDGYERQVIRFSVPAKFISDRCRVTVSLYVVNCITEETDTLAPLYFEGKSYTRKRIKRARKDHSLYYDACPQVPKSGHAFTVDTAVVCYRGRNSGLGNRRLDYKITVEDHGKQIYSTMHTGSCLRLRPFLFLTPTSNVEEKSQTDIDKIQRLKRLYFTERNNPQGMSDLLEEVMSIGYNRAVLYTTLEELHKQDEAMPLVDAMDNGNPVKWYLKAVLIARDADKVTDGVHHYLACLHHCLQMAPSFADYYKLDAQFSEELRKSHPYNASDADIYERIFNTYIK